jgi:hypothetical protein
VNSPITSRFLLISITITIIGAAATPLITAVQYSALIGLIGVRLSAMPAMLAKIRTP